MNDVQFGRFVRDGKTYNCVYDPTTDGRKGVLVRYWKDRPAATNFYQATDECRVKRSRILPW